MLSRIAVSLGALAFSLSTTGCLSEASEAIEGDGALGTARQEVKFSEPLNITEYLEPGASELQHAYAGADTRLVAKAFSCLEWKSISFQAHGKCTSSQTKEADPRLWVVTYKSLEEVAYSDDVVGHDASLRFDCPAKGPDVFLVVFDDLNRNGACMSVHVDGVAVGSSTPVPPSTFTDPTESVKQHALTTAKVLQRSIAVVRDKITSLEADIASLEWQNSAKINQINALVQNIEKRKAEVEAEYERKRQLAILSCLLGYCNVGAVSLAMALDDDYRLKQLNAQLQTVKSEQASILQEKAAYERKRDKLRAHLKTLQDKEAEITTLLRTNGYPAAPLPTSLAAYPELPALARKIELLSSLKSNLDGQVTTLLEIRTLAAELGQAIDKALAAAQSASAEADKQAEASRKAFYELLKIVTAGDVNAAADKWLENWVAKKTQQVLKDLGWDPQGLVDHLVKEAFPGAANSPAAAQLRKALLTSIQQAA